MKKEEIEASQWFQAEMSKAVIVMIGVVFIVIINKLLEKRPSFYIQEYRIDPDDLRQLLLKSDAKDAQKGQS